MADLHCSREIIEHKGKNCMELDKENHKMTRHEHAHVHRRIGVTEQICRVDKIDVFLTLDCRISAIEDLSHKPLESHTRASVHFCTNQPIIFKSKLLQRLAVTHTQTHKPITITLRLRAQVNHKKINPILFQNLLEVKVNYSHFKLHDSLLIIGF